MHAELLDALSASLLLDCRSGKAGSLEQQHAAQQRWEGLSHKQAEALEEQAAVLDTVAPQVYGKMSGLGREAIKQQRGSSDRDPHVLQELGAGALCAVLSSVAVCDLQGSSSSGGDSAAGRGSSSNNSGGVAAGNGSSASGGSAITQISPAARYDAADVLKYIGSKGKGKGKAAPQVAQLHAAMLKALPQALPVLPQALPVLPQALQTATQQHGPLFESDLDKLVLALLPFQLRIRQHIAAGGTELRDLHSLELSHRAARAARGVLGSAADDWLGDPLEKLWRHITGEVLLH
jgi:hypothetical protein